MSFVMQVHQTLQNLQQKRHYIFLKTWLMSSKLCTTFANLFTDNSKVWFKNRFNLSDHICQRPTIHVLKNQRDSSIMIEGVVANYNMWALGSLIYFQLLHNLFTNFFLYVHLNHLSAKPGAFRSQKQLNHQGIPCNI